jgi:hypothetical protein
VTDPFSPHREFNRGCLFGAVGMAVVIGLIMWLW